MATAVILHLAHNGDVSLTGDGILVVSAILFMLLLILINIGVVAQVSR